MGCEDLALHINAHQRSWTLDEALNNQVDIKSRLFILLTLASFISSSHAVKLVT